MRLGASIFLGLTAYWLYRARLSFDGNEQAAFAGGLILLFLNSIFTYYGVSPNTETYFIGLTALGLWMMLSAKNKVNLFLAGLVLGLGFMIKYVVAFDGLAFGLLLVWDRWQKGKNLVKGIVDALMVAIGAALPLLATMFYYNQLGYLEEFLFYTFEISSRYPITQSWHVYVVYVVDFFLRYFPITFFFVFVLLSKHMSRRLRLFGSLWSLLVLMVILIPGNKFGHYFIQFMLPFSFVAGSIFGLKNEQLPRFLRGIFAPKTGLVLISLLIIVNWILQYGDYIAKPDHPRQIEAIIKPEMGPQDRLYTSTSHQIVHHLVHSKPLLKHVHPSLFWEKKHVQALEINIEEEMDLIKQGNPKFILWRTNVSDERLNDYLEEHYVLIRKIGREFLFKRIDQ